MCFSLEALNMVPARISILHMKSCFHFTSALIVLCYYRGNPRMPLLLEALGPLGLWMQANGNQLTPVESIRVLFHAKLETE